MATIVENNGRKPIDQSRDARQRQDVSLKVNTLSTQVVAPGDVLDSNTPLDALFLSGTRERLTITQACRITSLPGGSISAVTVQRDVRGVVLTGLEIGTLSIQTNATVVLHGCRLTGVISVANMATLILQGCSMASPVTLVAGAKAQVVASAFVGTSSILNAGAPGNAYVLGCSRQSGVAHTNTTIIAETT